MTNQHNTFTNQEENQFFTAGKFNFEALAELIPSELATRVKNVVGFFGINTFNYEENGRCMFLRFYAADTDLITHKIVSCYWDKKDHFDVDYISHIDLGALGLKVVREEKEDDKSKNITI
ncbi:hypothetical protein M670_00480 [Schinkia azotoformans MEV2011]|uniref:Uncharacterized protein n=1 Tax=Schinkia azotoformans MEV2011 TaxID=1348973 RepID=A0A072NRW2_SCHAZ|nr:hypothetical protein [Schinkia azotoformans]KEF40454.1 hypothetical protein M670_00480 [Schinkia azotoformans MEV2011]MEC1696136.1 hypothetical protein [Schinkia azotoformans]MEC1716649.1 hypothetical protein [Schinkia azotoformans]MEC1725361.1 hypothetical protein [Schinkia azotoformans]MEC1739488.1 hypothetical protein [Schinkia azotoformans]